MLRTNSDVRNLKKVKFMNRAWVSGDTQALRHRQFAFGPLLYSAGSELFGSELGFIKAQPVQPNDVFLIPRHIRVVLLGPGVYAAL